MDPCSSTTDTTTLPFVHVPNNPPCSVKSHHSELFPHTSYPNFHHHHHASSQQQHHQAPGVSTQMCGYFGADSSPVRSGFVAANLCDEIGSSSQQRQLISSCPEEEFSDSDTDEVSRTPTQSDGPTLQSMRRKQRRGRIEKKRRDRINHCLAELRRLVPAAYEKQGSQKLEKAEILQMTVEHLKQLQAAGLNPLGCEPMHRGEVRSFGFRQCASQVDRFFTQEEGMDMQDSKRERLERYLQCNGTQYNVMHCTQQPNQWSTTTDCQLVLPSAATATMQNGNYHN